MASLNLDMTSDFDEFNLSPYRKSAAAAIGGGKEEIAISKNWSKFS